MNPTLEVLFSPAEWRALSAGDLTGTVCVVVDVLRASSAFVTALAHGAEAVVPVASIAEALEQRARRPDVLLAGEREGRRIGAALTGGVEFDLGNSPREFTSERVAGRLIVSTTTNGTGALRACAGASGVLVASWLNVSATVAELEGRFGGLAETARVLVVCAGTGEGAALEDTLLAGALAAALAVALPGLELLDSAEIARAAYAGAREDLVGTVRRARNARRLLAHPELRDDVAFCLQRDRFPIVAGLDAAGWVRRLPAG
ncbi:MAG: 2-phosphosulfolactate phosphatase [Verrucomicrobiae bacterium]|nr:2-phosphosulfolactate phosphatase [Verrucomicrobiae bacterium]MDW8308867.1 2-phosphosulfolactate phosphatase [Verrucomicrobiales bacterium]